MIVCVCNHISEKDLANNPELIRVVGNKCGTCIRAGDCTSNIQFNLNTTEQ